MRKVILIILSGLLGIHLNAQQTISTDSVYLFEQTSRQLEWAHTSSTHLLLRNYKNVARSQLYTGHEQGSFHRSQEAYRLTTAGFHTDGIKTLGRFTLAGQFDFEKRWEDSAAWYNGGEYHAAQPYYFFAGKAGKYEKQLYNLAATATYDLLKNKLYLGIGGNYRYHWTTRSVDPRPNVKSFAVTICPELTWRHKQHLLGAGVLWARGSEDTDIGYKNRDFSGNQTYIERNNFMSLGFGYIGKLDRYLHRYNETNGFFVHYATQFNNWTLQASGGYELWQEDIATDRTTTRSHHDTYAFLQQDKTHGGLLLSHTHNRTRQQWELQVQTQSLLNWASEFNATSYQYTATEARVTYRQSWQQQNGISLELGAGCDYQEQYKEDIVASHIHQFQTITPHVYAAIYRHAANKSWMGLSLTPSFRYRLNNEMSVPATQENYFTQGVVYTDYLYWDRNNWGVETKINYIQKEKAKRNRLGGTLRIQWQQATGATVPLSNALYIPTGSRWSAAASLNLYL